MIFNAATLLRKAHSAKQIRPVGCTWDLYPAAYRYNAWDSSGVSTGLCGGQDNSDMLIPGGWFEPLQIG